MTVKPVALLQPQAVFARCFDSANWDPRGRYSFCLFLSSALTVTSLRASPFTFLFLPLPLHHPYPPLFCLYSSLLPACSLLLSSSISRCCCFPTFLPIRASPLHLQMKWISCFRNGWWTVALRCLCRRWSLTLKWGAAFGFKYRQYYAGSRTSTLNLQLVQNSMCYGRYTPNQMSVTGNLAELLSPWSFWCVPHHCHCPSSPAFNSAIPMPIQGVWQWARSISLTVDVTKRQSSLSL